MAGLLEYTKNGQVTEPPLYRFMRGNVQSFLNSIPDPSKMTPEQQLAMGLNANPIMGLLGTTAYHGSPYLFDKFDTSKIGTGEGAQTYGHGLYFAENPIVAEYYRSKLMPTQEFLQKVAKGEDVKGNLYKVDIPDTHISSMLDWDKPLGQQAKNVQEAINKTKKNLTEEDIMMLGGDANLLYGKDVTPNQFLNTWEIIRGQKNIGESLLNQSGVKGVKYFDNQSREGLKGTRNFVVFDPTDIQILERNNKGLLK